MKPSAALSKQDLVARYEEILDRGCLGPEDRARVRNGQDVPGVIIQQSGGSSGATPLRLPRMESEIHWLAGKLLEREQQAHGTLPTRVAFIGGISHTEARLRADVDLPIAIEDFSGSELAALDDFDPDVISMYPSFARKIVSRPGLRLKRLRSVKLGGETILPSDLHKLRGRFGDVTVIEQFGSTEMPALAFRTLGDPAYALSTDRFDFDLGEGEGWQPLLVRDRFPGRAFPIDDWYDTGDDVFVEEGEVLRVRRRNDPAFPWLGRLDELLEAGFANIQVMPREGRVLVAGGTERPPAKLTLGERSFEVVLGPPYRLVDSNKMPLWLDTDRVDLARMYRSSDDEVTHG